MNLLSDTAEGWSLKDALERTADPDLWADWKAAEAAWEAVRTRPREGWQPSSKSISETRQKAVGACEEIRKRTWDHLLQGRLIAFGSPAGPSEEPRAVHSQAWIHMAFRSISKSVVQERIGSKTKLYNVRIFPLVHSPDAFRRLSGSTLGTAFKKCVVDDPVVMALSQRILKGGREHQAVFREGQFPGLFIDFKWPLNLTPSDLAYSFVRVPIYFVGDPLPKPSNEVCRVAEVIADRVAALRSLLVNGRIIARGTYKLTGQVAEIDPAQWARRDVQIEVQNGDLIDTEDLKPVTRWTGLSVWAADELHWGQRGAHPATFHGKPREYDRVPQTASAYGEPEEPALPIQRKAVETAEARGRVRRECCDWLEKEMRGSPSRKLFPKAYWRQQANSRWGAILSYRSFDQAWDEAVSRSGAAVWAAAGAPKRSKR